MPNHPDDKRIPSDEALYIRQKPKQISVVYFFHQGKQMSLYAFLTHRGVKKSSLFFSQRKSAFVPKKSLEVKGVLRFFKTDLSITGLFSNI